MIAIPFQLTPHYTHQVATCLPELGDYNSIAVSSSMYLVSARLMPTYGADVVDNGFAFAHFVCH